MPLTKIQTDILRLLASHRDPESYVARATPPNRDWSRHLLREHFRLRNLRHDVPDQDVGFLDAGSLI